MIDKVKAELNSDRAYLKNRIQAAQLMLADVTLPNRQDKARVQLETLKEQISERVAQLDEEIKQLSMEEGGDDEDSGDEGMVGGKTSGQRAGFLRLRKIEWLEQLHRVHHFLGAVYFQMAELKETQSGRISKPSLIPMPKIFVTLSLDNQRRTSKSISVFSSKALPNSI